MNSQDIKTNFLALYNKHLSLRAGSEDLLIYLNSTDFFEAPASTKFHSAFAGGLAQHSLSVAELLLKKNAEYQLGYSEDTIVICGLLHDVCKANFYKFNTDSPTDSQLSYLMKLSGEDYTGRITKGFASKLIDWHKNGRQGDAPEDVQEYTVEDQLPIGHGEKSIYMINRHMELTKDEAMAIRWHMVSFDAGIHFQYPSGFPFNQAMHTCKLVTALFTADMEASNLLEDGASKLN